MAESKKITELNSIPSLADDDEFVVIDKSITAGNDASATGKTSKATMQQLRDGMFPNGAPAGEKGAKGETGPQGIMGLTGEKGPIGSAGEGGPAGPPGGYGPQGQKGNTGATGASGGTGPQGPVGNTGATGGTGPQGQKGQKGLGGSTGSNGGTGAKGQKGQTGQTGSQGVTGSAAADHVLGFTKWSGAISSPAPVSSSYNVSSIVDGGTGYYKVYWTNPSATSSYAAVCSATHFVENGDLHNVNHHIGEQNQAYTATYHVKDTTANTRKDPERVHLVSFK